MSLLAALVSTSQRIAATRARSVKTQALAAYLKTLEPDEVAIAVHYLSGAVPQGRFGMSYSKLQEATVDAAANAATLSIVAVDRRLHDIAALRGSGSAAKRTQALRELFARATADERSFLIALLVGELRQGALEGVMVDAIAAAADLPGDKVRRAAMYAPDLGSLAQAALGGATAALDSFALRLFAPVAPMLAQTAADVPEALGQLQGDVSFEWKMDGARIQAHKRGDDVRLYTRALNEVTAAVPEIVAKLRALPAHSAILDGEALACTPAGRPHAFQVTMRRFGRKLDVHKLLEELPMRAYFFDCLLLEDRVLADLPLAERLVALSQALPEAMRVPRLASPSIPEANEFYAAALAAGHEGVMAKSLASPYEAGNRGASWLKIKRAHTLDLVVLAAEWGHGRRSGKLSNLHLGALDPASGEYVMLGKTFKGLTDVMLQWQTQELLAREVRSDRHTVYVRPEIVAEIAFSDLQASARYPGGVALRLARVKRYRDDKTAAQADTMESVRRIFAAQG
jgi:DNA ligase-1